MSCPGAGGGAGKCGQVGSVSPSRSGSQGRAHAVAGYSNDHFVHSSFAWCAPDAHCLECNLPYFLLLPDKKYSGLCFFTVSFVTMSVGNLPVVHIHMNTTLSGLSRWSVQGWRS